MSLFPFATTIATWKRATAIVLDSATPVASMAGDRPPVRESSIQVYLGGSPTGTVTVAGNVDGSPDTEVLTWAGEARHLSTLKRFTGALTFTTSLTGATSIQAEAVSPGGEPQVGLTTLRGPGHPVTVEEINEGTNPTRRQGGQEEGTNRILVQYEDVWTPRRGDRVTDDMTGEVYEVLKVERKASGLYTSHWACRAKHLQGKGST